MLFLFLLLEYFLNVLLFSFWFNMMPSSGIVLSPMIRSQEGSCPFSYSIILASILYHFELLNSGNCLLKLAHLVIWLVPIVQYHTCVRAHTSYGGQFLVPLHTNNKLLPKHRLISICQKSTMFLLLFLWLTWPSKYGHAITDVLRPGPKNAQFH